MGRIEDLKAARSDALDAFAKVEEAVVALAGVRKATSMAQGIKSLRDDKSFMEKTPDAADLLVAVEELCGVRNDMTHSTALYVQPKGGAAMLYRNVRETGSFPTARLMSLDAHNTFAKKAKSIAVKLKP